mmetsp:Transcript_6567/g.25370  ORF Transcript_6567/g.25370 Transcript_6567/m.25370 type:complete len:386 (-) Transcript_6567:254-1411(-)
MSGIGLEDDEELLPLAPREARFHSAEPALEVVFGEIQAEEIGLHDPPAHRVLRDLQRVHVKPRFHTDIPQQQPELRNLIGRINLRVAEEQMPLGGSHLSSGHRSTLLAVSPADHDVLFLASEHHSVLFPAQDRSFHQLSNEEVGRGLRQRHFDLVYLGFQLLLLRFEPLLLALGEKAFAGQQLAQLVEGPGVDLHVLLQLLVIEELGPVAEGRDAIALEGLDHGAEAVGLQRPGPAGDVGAHFEAEGPNGRHVPPARILLLGHSVEQNQDDLLILGNPLHVQLSMRPASCAWLRLRLPAAHHSARKATWLHRSRIVQRPEAHALVVSSIGRLRVAPQLLALRVQTSELAHSFELFGRGAPRSPEGHAVQPEALLGDVVQPAALLD